MELFRLRLALWQEDGNRLSSQNVNFCENIIWEKNSMKIIGMIPARYESKRFPGKAIADIAGKPMIYWVYRQAKKVRGLDDVVVATDSEIIRDVCSLYGIRTVMTCREHKTGTDRIAEAADKLTADFYVNIQGDEPLIEPKTIQSVIDYYKEHPETQIINTKTVLREDDDVNSRTIVKVVSADNGDGIYLSRLPVPFPKNGQKVIYYKHLGLYGLTREALLFFSRTPRTANEKIEDIEMLRFLESGYKIKFITVDSSAVGVDTPEDIIKAEAEMKRLKEEEE